MVPSKARVAAWGLWIALGVWRAAAADTPPAVAASSGPTTPASTDVPTGPLQEVVVTGLKASLEKSLEIKKNADVIEDSINATELGRFPDADVADSLEHLPGISITRTTGGEGESVTVRGLGTQYNIVTLNNRILATDDDSRDVAFDVLPSEVISGADVLKSPQASALEGSIGGTINLRTASPFDDPGLHGGVHAEGNYNSMSQLHGQKYSFFGTDTVADNTLGFLFGAVYSDNNQRTDSLNAYNQNIYGPTTYPYAGGAGSVPLTATPCCITFGSIFDQKKREAVSGKVEWRPSNAFTLTADALFTHLDDPQVGYNQSYYFAADPAGDGWGVPVIQNGLVTSVTSQNFTPEIVNNTINRKVDTIMTGLNASWKPTERLTIGVDTYLSLASRPEGGQDSFVTAGLVSSSPNAVDTITVTDEPNSLPDLNVTVPPSQLGLTACPTGTASKTTPGSCSYTALMNSGYLDNNKYWSTHYDGLNGYSVHDRIEAISLDNSFDVSEGFFKSILFGAGDNRREKERVDSSNDWTNGSGQYGTLYETAGCPVQCNPYTFGSQGFNVISFSSPPNFLAGAGGSYPSVLPQLNVPQLLSFLRSLNGKPNPFYCSALPCASPFAFSETLPQPNPFNSYDVTEKTATAYVELEFGGDRWSGNLGVRLVHTATDAATAVTVPVSLWTPTTINSTQTWNVQYSTAQSLVDRGQYTYPLPSANLSYWLVQHELQLRVAAAETMSRPELYELAPTSTNNAENGQPQLSYNGTAGLKPTRAYQADLSIEWYYQPHSAFNVAAFYKKIVDDIYQGTESNVNLGTLAYIGGPPGTVPGTPFLWTITAPANGAESIYDGVEISWQHFLQMGLGVHADYTRTWSKGFDQNGNPTGPVNEAPPVTASVSLIYDKGPFNVDVTLDHTSSYTYFCSQCTEVPGWPAIADSFNWLTASIHYRFLKGFDVYVEGKNLTNSIARTYLNGNPLLPWAPGQAVGQDVSGVGAGYSAYGRSYVLGASYRF